MSLSEKGTVATGTVMPNSKKMPKAQLNAAKPGLKKGDIVSFRHGPLLCLCWKDKKEVLMLSTQHNDDVAQVGVRAEGGRRLKDKPVCVENYNQKMGGVDLNDQMMNYYPFERKSIKWWKKTFFHIFRIALVNSHILLSTSKCVECC